MRDRSSDSLMRSACDIGSGLCTRILILLSAPRTLVRNRSEPYPEFLQHSIVLQPRLSNSQMKRCRMPSPSTRSTDLKAEATPET